MGQPLIHVPTAPYMGICRANYYNIGQLLTGVLTGLRPENLVEPGVLHQTARW
jgi:hypothetical protein